MSFVALAGRVAILIDQRQSVARAILGPSATSTLLPDACNGIKLAIHSVPILVEHAADTFEALACFLSYSCDTPKTAMGQSKTVSNVWSPPANTQQQTDQLTQRRAGATSTVPTVNADVRTDKANGSNADMHTVELRDDVFMDDEDERQAALWDEVCGIGSDEERMADDMFADTAW